MAVRIIAVTLVFMALSGCSFERGRGIGFPGLAQADEIRLLHFDTRSGAQAFVSAHPESASTNVVSGPGGSMVWVSGPGEPPATEGMTVLGTSYAEVFGDPDRRALYDSVFPPGHYDAEGGFVETPGEERRFGMFAGREEMG